MKKFITISFIVLLMIMAAYFTMSSDIIFQDGGLNVTGILRAGNTLYANPTSGKVGINTQAPQSALDVNGNITVSDCIVFESGGDWCSS
jgi:hypothetical protein